MGDPFFSVVIPTYNRAEFISKTIDSVLRQSDGDLEVIVIDDGSTDNTEEVVSAVADPRLRYHRKKNEERAVARNTGTALAKGKYVTFLDSDDLLYEQHLQVAREVIDKYREPEVFHLGYEIRDEKSGAVRPGPDLPELANDILIDGNKLSCNGVFIRRDVAASHPFNSDRRLSGTEDYELWLRLASRFPIHCDSRITSVIVQHDSRSVVMTDRQKLEARIGLLEKYLSEDEGFIDRFGGRAAEFSANNRIYIALHLALGKNDRLGAIGYLIRSLICSPKALGNRAFYGTIKRLFV
jgi:glycosyltransferase involved in cell wall biosynthesis